MKRFVFLAGAVFAVAAMGWSGGNREAAGTAGPKDVKLSIMLTGLGRFKPQFDQYLAQFAEKEKAAKNLNVTYELELPSDQSLIKTRLASGDAPDVYSLHAAFEAPTFARGGYLPDLTSEPFVAKLFDNVREVVTIDGRVFGVPMESFTWSYLYNKAVFDRYGLKAPQTLSEMKQVVATLKGNGVAPFVLPYKDAYFAGWLAQLSFCAIAANGVPGWWERVAKGQASLGELQQKGMFDIIDLVNANGTPRALEVGADDGVARFARGDGAMLVTGPWYADSVLKVDPDFKLGLAGLPVNDSTQDTMVMLAVSTAVTVWPKSPNKAVGVDLLNYILDDTDSSPFFEALRFNRLSKTQDIPTFPWTSDGLGYVEMSRTYRDRAIPNSPNDTLGRMAQLYYAGEITQDQFVSEVDQAWKKSVELGN
jgi:raffinose/stachyose/melibiose transport system substrate-binding protein